MKRFWKWLAVSSFCVLALGAFGCSSSSASKQAPAPAAPAKTEQAAAKAGNGKTLVVYFSATGNTKRVAEWTAAETGGDIFAIQPEQPYTDADLDYNNQQSRVSKEHANPTQRPAYKGDVKNWAQYDRVFLGYPIWWGQAPCIVYTFVEKHDFTGKTVIPFATSAMSPLSDSGTNLAKAAKVGTWQEGRRFDSGAAEQEVRNWARGLKK